MPVKPETQLKRWATSELKKRGGYSLPIPGGLGAVTGSPDRMIFYRGQVFAAEFKAPGRKLSPGQEIMKQRIEATGCRYLIIQSKDDFYRGLGIEVLLS
jgi:hypothetical protein